MFIDLNSISFSYASGCAIARVLVSTYESELARDLVSWFGAIARDGVPENEFDLETGRVGGGEMSTGSAVRRLKKDLTFWLKVGFRAGPPLGCRAVRGL